MVNGKYINVLLVLAVFFNDWSTLFTHAQDDEDEDEEEDDSATHTTTAAVKLSSLTKATTQQTIVRTTSALTTRAVVQNSTPVNSKASVTSNTTPQVRTATTGSAHEEEEDVENSQKKTTQQETPVKSKTTDNVATEGSKFDSPCPTVECVKNPKYFDKKGELIVPIPPDIGKFHKACGTKIILGNKFKSRLDYLAAEKLCCQLGMRLASPFLLESKEKQKCFQELYKNNHTGELMTQYRMSGMDSGGILTWCSTGEKSYRNASWESGLKVMKVTSDVTCVTSFAAAASMTLQFSPCKINLPFMCEDVVGLKNLTALQLEIKNEKNGSVQHKGKDSSCNGPKCVPNVCTKTRMSSSSFAPNGTLLFSENNKVIYREGCGGSFILDVSKKQFISGQSKCCKFGMLHINIETVEKLTCLDQLFEGYKQRNYEYLTRASDFRCPGKWGWCDHPEVTMDPQLWVTGKIMGAKGECAVLQFSAENKTKAGIKNISCVNSFYVMCENLPHDTSSITSATSVVKPVVQSAQVTNIKPKMAKNCNHVCNRVSCNRTSAASQYLTPQGTLKLGQKGVVVTACGIKYIVALTKQDMNQHLRDCCEFGMRAAEIETQKELTCLEAKLKEQFKTKQSFMTRSTSVGCPGTWGWCDSKSAVDPALWLAKQPAVDGCAVLEFNPETGKRSGLTALPASGCASKLMFICKICKSKI